MTIPPVIVFLGIYISGLTCVYANEQICNVIEDKSPRYQLKRSLLCDYDAHVNPRDKSVVRVWIIPRLAEYNDRSNSLDLHVWLFHAWTDPHLSWTPGDYAGMNETQIKSSEIWTPTIYSLTSRNRSIPESNCALSKKGRVICVPLLRYSITCDSDYAFWPYDRHNCTVQLGAWSHRGSEVEISSSKFDVTMKLYQKNPQWKIALADVYSSKSKFLLNDNFPTMSAFFVVKRSSLVVRSIVVSPVIVLTVMTMTTLWLRPGSFERLIVSCTNLLGHFMALQSVNWHLPSTESSPPNIFLFYNNSLILSAIALILTCWLQRLTNWKRQVPAWLSAYVSVILASKPGQILLLSVLDPKVSARLEENADDNNDLVNSESNKSNWEYVVVLIGWIAFFSFLVTYFIMFGIFLRYPPSDDHLYDYF